MSADRYDAGRCCWRLETPSLMPHSHRRSDATKRSRRVASASAVWLWIGQLLEACSVLHFISATVSNLVTTALEAGQDVNIYVLVESGTNECLLLLFIVPIYLDFRRLSPVAADSIHSRPDATELDTFVQSASPVWTRHGTGSLGHRVNGSFHLWCELGVTRLALALSATLAPSARSACVIFRRRRAVTAITAAACCYAQQCCCGVTVATTSAWPTDAV